MGDGSKGISLGGIVICLFAIVIEAHAATIWNGPSISFFKTSFADPTLAANQDRITDNVWIARGNQQGLFNSRLEGAYTRDFSPADTEWAWDLAGFNSGLAIEAENYAALTFNDWRTAHGSRPLDTIGLPGVLHLISEDIYINIRIDSWAFGGDGGQRGGAFSYTRATSLIPLPKSFVLTASGLAFFGLVFIRRRNRI